MSSRSSALSGTLRLSRMSQHSPIFVSGQASVISQLRQKGFELRPLSVALALYSFSGHGIFPVQIFQRSEAGPLVGAEIAFISLHEQTMEPVQDHATGFVTVDLFARRGDEFLFLLFRGA